MKVIIHRGTHQIGGCVTEIATSSTRIIIDFGMELPDENGIIKNHALRLDGVNLGIPNCDAVLFTHYHGDHTGLLHEILPGIPLYMGRVSQQILIAFHKRLRSPSLPMMEHANAFLPLIPITIGDIVITPIPADHSAYDASMFLIKADGKKVLFTGDFRLHGFRSAATPKIIHKYVGDVDLLISEGTLLSRKKSVVKTEYELQANIRALINNYKYAFVLCSSTNIDRLAAFHNATPRGRYFICDSYQKGIFDIVAKDTKSNYYRFQKALIYGPNLKIREKGFVMAVRKGEKFRSIMQQYMDDDSILIYSMWDGYIDGRDQRILDFVRPFSETGKMKIMHTSGHATDGAIKKLCHWTSAKKILLIHTDTPEMAHPCNMGADVVSLQDGQEFIVS